FEYKLSGKTLKRMVEHLLTNTDYKNAPKAYQQSMLAPDAIHFSYAAMKHGALEIASDEPLTQEKENILLRFTNVIDHAYTRFDDLRQAEAQAREAQIEAALERVRSRSMAMHKSNELTQVAAVIFQQLQELGIIDLRRCFISIFNKTATIVENWYTSEQGDSNTNSFSIPTTEDPTIIEITKSWKQKRNISIELSGIGLQDYIIFLLHHGYIYPKGENPPISLVLNSCPFSYGVLVPITYKPLLESEFELLERFAKVFEQTYTRFLDLQKAEEQAEEARIENALEKVRSRSLAMHKSEELLQVVSVVFKQLKNLELDVVTSSISINSENKKDFNLWMASDNLDKPQKLHVPYLKHPLFDRSIAAINNGKDSINETFTREEKNKYFKWAFENSVLKNLSDEVKNFMLNAEGYSMAVAIMKHTQVAIMKYDGIKYDEQDVEIVKRFARVFDQAYTRFLDLQKAEAQA
ncbi:MAG: hypothetical protein KAI99_19755, partial [Cyclobacteriaceae bacterium]|nr:hypothetical protein [Cyclobacteriaceae bacterium]